MGLSAAYVSRLPFTATMVYLGIGILLGPIGWKVIALDLGEHTSLFHRAAEITVVISLFSVGLKLRLPLRDRRWLPALLLATVSMTITVGLLAAIGVWGLGLPIGAAILLGGILAPTDPVLASEVQLEHAGDRNELRLALSGEAGLNDGTAFPFVMLGLGLLGLHDLGAWGWRWWAVDVVWAIGGGLGIGAVLGYGTGRLILHLRKMQREAATLDEYLLLGLIGLSYGAAVKCHAYGFLSVFAAGVAVRAVERHLGGVKPEEAEKLLSRAAKDRAAVRDPHLAPAYLAGALLSFNEQIERILEVGMVLLVGAALFTAGVAHDAWWFGLFVFVLVRPLAVLPVWWTGQFSRKQFSGVAWFGIRGIGSIYYLMYAIDHGLEPSLAETITSLTLTIVAASIVLHGISVTPLLRYLLKGQRRAAQGGRGK